MALPSSLPICLPPSLSSETVSWGQSMTGLLRAMGHISSIKKEQYRRSHHPVPYLPYRLLGSHFTSGWEITSEFGKLSSLHLSWLERHKVTNTKIYCHWSQTQFNKAFGLKEIEGSLFLPPLLTYLCRIKISIHEHIGNYISILLIRNMSATKFFIQNQDFESS